MEKNSIIVSVLFALFILSSITVAGCGKRNGSVSDRSVQAVKNSITKVSASGRNYQTGPL
jgi:hypothetical protein